MSNKQQIDRIIGIASLVSVGAVLVGAFVHYSNKLAILNENKMKKNHIEIEKRIKIENRSIKSSENDDQPAKVEHFGSCHCKRIKFKIKTNSNGLRAVDIPTKIRFPRLTIKCTDFESLTENDTDISMYCVSSSNTNNDSNPTTHASTGIGIYSFCSHCGVHVLFSPSLEPTFIQVNVDCLNLDSIEELSISYLEVPESVGITLHDLNIRGKGQVENNAVVHQCATGNVRSSHTKTNNDVLNTSQGVDVNSGATVKTPSGAAATSFYTKEQLQQLGMHSANKASESLSVAPPTEKWNPNTSSNSAVVSATSHTSPCTGDITSEHMGTKGSAVSNGYPMNTPNQASHRRDNNSRAGYPAHGNSSGVSSSNTKADVDQWVAMARQGYPLNSNAHMHYDQNSPVVAQSFPNSKGVAYSPSEATIYSSMFPPTAVKAETGRQIAVGPSNIGFGVMDEGDHSPDALPNNNQFPEQFRRHYQSSTHLGNDFSGGNAYAHERSAMNLSHHPSYNQQSSYSYTSGPNTFAHPGGSALIPSNGSSFLHPNSHNNTIRAAVRGSEYSPYGVHSYEGVSSNKHGQPTNNGYGVGFSGHVSRMGNGLNHASNRIVNTPMLKRFSRHLNHHMEHNTSVNTVNPSDSYDTQVNIHNRDDLTHNRIGNNDESRSMYGIGMSTQNDAGRARASDMDGGYGESVDRMQGTEGAMGTHYTWLDKQGRSHVQQQPNNAYVQSNLQSEIELEARGIMNLRHIPGEDNLRQGQHDPHFNHLPHNSGMSLQGSGNDMSVRQDGADTRADPRGGLEQEDYSTNTLLIPSESESPSVVSSPAHVGLSSTNNHTNARNESMPSNATEYVYAHPEEKSKELTSVMLNYVKENTIGNGNAKAQVNFNKEEKNEINKENIIN